MPHPRPTLIVAASANRVIGRDGALPWHMPADLTRFKRVTMGHHLIMGRKTWDAVGRPLPGRISLVLTRDEGWAAEGAVPCGSIDEALRRAKGDPEPFVIGGESIFRQTLPLAARVDLTLIHAEIEGDTVFPELDEAAWRLVSDERHDADAKNRHPYSFRIYERSDAAGSPSLGTLAPNRDLR